MSYKIAGIDVHKKVLMVVVMDASTPDCQPERRRFAITECDPKLQKHRARTLARALRKLGYNVQITPINPSVP